MRFNGRDASHLAEPSNALRKKEHLADYWIYLCVDSHFRLQARHRQCMENIYIYLYSFTLVSEVGFDLIGMFRLLQSEKWISSDWTSAIATIRFGSCERPRIHVANW